MNGWERTISEQRAEIERMRSLLPETIGWRPIETVPKDGTPILLFLPESDTDPIVVARWVEFEGKQRGAWYAHRSDSSDPFAERGFSIDVDATHWMPLPEPPK